MPRTLHLARAAYGAGAPGQHGLWKDSHVVNRLEPLTLLSAVATHTATSDWYESHTLCGNLGLPIPTNRYTREHERDLAPELVEA